MNTEQIAELQQLAQDAIFGLSKAHIELTRIDCPIMAGRCLVSIDNITSFIDGLS